MNKYLIKIAATRYVKEVISDLRKGAIPYIDPDFGKKIISTSKGLADVKGSIKEEFQRKRNKGINYNKILGPIRDSLNYRTKK